MRACGSAGGRHDTLAASHLLLSAGWVGGLTLVAMQIIRTCASHAPSSHAGTDPWSVCASCGCDPPGGGGGGGDGHAGGGGSGGDGQAPERGEESRQAQRKRDDDDDDMSDDGDEDVGGATALRSQQLRRA